MQALLNNLNIKTQTESILADKHFNMQGFEKVFNNKIGQCTQSSEPKTKTITQELNETVQEVLEEGALDLSLLNEAEKTEKTEEIKAVEETEATKNSQIGEELMNYDTNLSTTIENTIPQVVLADNSIQNSYNEITETTTNQEITENLEVTESSELIASKPKEDVSEPKTLKDLVEEEMLEELNIESVEVDTASLEGGEDSNLMNNQSPQEQGLKAILHIENDVKAEFKPIETAQAKPVSDSSKILDQITKQIENMQNNSRLNIVLNPGTLGKVSLQLINTKEGLSAQFTVTTQEARDAIMKGLDNLKNSLTSQGVSVDNVTVKLNESQGSEYNPDWTEQEGSRGSNKEQKGSGKNQKEREKFEQTMFTAQNSKENGKV